MIGLTLCPWARPVQPSIHFVQTEAPNREGVYLALYDELQNLASGTPPEVPETTILVAPYAFKDDFLEFHALVVDFEDFLEETALEFQVVGFHPHHVFGGEDPSDPGNFVNRSPHPMVHILRQASITDAVEANPKLAGSVPSTNQALLRSLHAVFSSRTEQAHKGLRQSGARLASRVDHEAIAAWISRGGDEEQRAMTFTDFLQLAGVQGLLEPPLEPR